jgi:hypothetical protein
LKLQVFIGLGAGFVIVWDMRRVVVILCGLVLVGCSSSRKDKPVDHSLSDAAPASALVFTPPISYDVPPLDLSREPRARAAFVGYEDLTTTFFYLRLDDRQIDSKRGRFERRAVTERIGVSYR